MLDAFLKVAYEKKSAHDARNEMAEAMMELPNEELAKIASGEEKLAYLSEKGGGGCWLDQFKGTPLYDEALALEEQELQIEAEDIQNRQEERARRDPIWEQRDAVCLKKRLLELKLRQGESGGGEAEEPMEEDLEEPPAEEEPVELEEEAEPEEKAASALDEFAKLGHDMRVESMRKMAADLSPGLAGLGLGAMATPSMVVQGALDPRMTAGQGAKASLGAALGGALGGQGTHEIVRRLPVSEKVKALAPLAGIVAGSTSGAALGAHLGRPKKDEKTKKQEGEKKEASSIVAMRKEAKELTMKGREQIKEKNFAIPKGEGPGDTGKYPIHDEEHARNALTRVRTHGTPKEKSKVYDAVAKKYPGLAARSSVESVREEAKKDKKASANPELLAEMRLEAALEKRAAALPQSPEQAADMWGRKMAHMEKGAFAGALMGAARAAMPAMKAGLSGAGKGIMQAGKALKGAHAAGGMQAVGKKLPTIAAGMAGKAGQFAQKNPMAAAGLGAGALGAAGLGGAALG